MTREEAISVLENPDVSLEVRARIGQEDEYWKKLSPAMEMAISALRAQQEADNLCGLTFAQLGRLVRNCYIEGYEDCKAGCPPLEKNEPLTLEELREMGGEPYWLVGLREDSAPPHWSILDSFVAEHIEDYRYGENWLAYRRKPKEVQK